MIDPVDLLRRELGTTKLRYSTGDGSYRCAYVSKLNHLNYVPFRSLNPKYFTIYRFTPSIGSLTRGDTFPRWFNQGFK